MKLVCFVQDQSLLGLRLDKLIDIVFLLVNSFLNLLLEAFVDFSERILLVFRYFQSLAQTQAFFFEISALVSFLLHNDILLVQLVQTGFSLEQHFFRVGQLILERHRLRAQLSQLLRLSAQRLFQGSYLLG